MILKAEVLAAAAEAQLLPTTIEKDYALGWFLFGIAQHAELRRWIFKGGTCLKKCCFDTYRFSGQRRASASTATPSPSPPCAPRCGRTARPAR